jgi:signal peptidase II
MQRNPGFRAGLLVACVALGIILVDRATKLIIVRALEVHESIPVIGGFFSLTHLRNRAGVFGLGPQNPLIFTIASCAALVFLVYLFRTLEPHRRLQHVAFGLIMGGALGNLIDRVFGGERIFQGAVTDFLDFSIRGHHWPPFNIADSAITVGVGLFLFRAVLSS